MSHALDILQFEIASSELMPTPFGLFLNPDTRDPGGRFWISWSPSTIPRVLDSQARDVVDESTDVVVIVRLDTLLTDLEQRTQDHAGVKRDDAWMKRGPASVQSLIEAALAAAS